MDLFGLKAHEDEHRDTHLALRRLVEQVSQLTINLAQTRVELRKLTLQVDGKIDTAEVDPAILGVNQALGDARVKLAEVAAAAEENWNAMSEELENAVDDINVKSESLSEESEGDEG
ncbi:MAG: hypothetical protein ACR2QO_23715 [Acidimicrobiales bacterium]